MRPLPEIAADELGTSNVLRFVNVNWHVDPLPNPFEKPRTTKQRVQHRLAQLVIFVLAPYLERSESFFAHLVRYDNEVAGSHDQLLREVRLLREAVEDRLQRGAERVDSLGRRLDDRLDELAARIDRLETLE